MTQPTEHLPHLSPDPADDALRAVVAEFERFAAEEDALAVVRAGRRRTRPCLTERVAATLDEPLRGVDDATFEAHIADALWIVRAGRRG